MVCDESGSPVREHLQHYTGNSGDVACNIDVVTLDVQPMPLAKILPEEIAMEFGLLADNIQNVYSQTITSLIVS